MDAKLYNFMRGLMQSENIFIEPSSCASFQGAVAAANSPEIQDYIDKQQLRMKMKNATHIVWAKTNCCEKECSGQLKLDTERYFLFFVNFP